MDKNTIFTITALAIMATVGYAAYTNGSITDLSSVVNNQIGEVVSGSSNYLGAVLSTQTIATSTTRTSGLATSTTKAAGTRERNLPGTLKVLPVDPKTLNVDAPGVPILKFQITARQNNDDVIKYIYFEIKGKGPYKEGSYSSGVYIGSAEVLAFNDVGSIEAGGGIVHFVSMKKDSMVLRYGDEYTDNALRIPKGHTNSYVLKSRLIRASATSSPLSVRILKIAR